MQLSDGVSTVLSSWCTRGTCGLSAVDRSFLLRSDPFILWCDVVEEGLGYHVVTIKGLELQTTSCHALEATHLDEKIQETVERNPFFNPTLMYSIDVTSSIVGVHRCAHFSFYF